MDELLGNAPMNGFDVDEWITLAALENLDPEQRVHVEADLASQPDWESAALLSYGVPTVNQPPSLKERLWQKLDLKAVVDPVPPISPPMLVVRASQVNWQPYVVPNTYLAVLHVDESTREVVALFRAEAGVHYPNHRHAQVEEIYMLQGDLVVDGAVYGAGDYLRSERDSSHSPWTQGGCMFLVRTSLDDQFLDPPQGSNLSGS